MNTASSTALRTSPDAYRSSSKWPVSQLTAPHATIVMTMQAHVSQISRQQSRWILRADDSGVGIAGTGETMPLDKAQGRFAAAFSGRIELFSCSVQEPTCAGDCKLSMWRRTRVGA